MTSVKHPRMLGQLLAELEFLRRFQRQTFDGHELFWASNRAFRIETLVRKICTANFRALGAEFRLMRARLIAGLPASPEPSEPAEKP